MTAVIGHRMTHGCGVKYHCATGEGVLRNTASAVISKIGYQLVDTIANKVKGGSYKLTGSGRHHKVGRPKTHKKKK